MVRLHFYEGDMGVAWESCLINTRLVVPSHYTKTRGELQQSNVLPESDVLIIIGDNLKPDNVILTVGKTPVQINKYLTEAEKPVSLTFFSALPPVEVQSGVCTIS